MTESSSANSNSAIKVALGIFASRIIGLLRQRAIAHFFGVGAHADVFQAAIRGTNLLQNLLGEGTISAAFIPYYSKMLEEGRAEEAGRFAGAIFSMLLVAAAALSLLGFVLAGPIVLLFQPGWANDAEAVAAGRLAINRFDLTVISVKIIFPATGIVVLSAWALGVLNSHRKFLISYLAPVAWNAAIIASFFIAARLFADGQTGQLSTGALDRMLIAGCWGVFAGGILQFLVQLPGVVSVIRGFRLSLSPKVPGVSNSLKAFGPVVAGRGVYQLSGYLDQFMASYLAVGAVSAIMYAQLLYMLPVSLFAMSVAASELPELSRLKGDGGSVFVARIDRSLRQVMFLTIPTTVGYLGFGFLLVGALYRTGSFDVANNWLVYFVLVAYSLGLIATTGSRLLQNACYALHDTRTPARIAASRVAISSALSLPLMILLDRISVNQIINMPTTQGRLFLGGVGLALGSVFGAWFELFRLRAFLRRNIASFRINWSAIGRMAGLSLAAAVPAAVLWYLLPKWNVVVLAVIVVGVYSATYLASARFLGLKEGDAWIGQFLRRFRGKR